MNKKAASILSKVVLLIMIGCSDDVPQDKSTIQQASGNKRSESTLRIVIRWPGDDFASKQDLEVRNNIERLIAGRSVGKIIRVGTGMGWMDISLEVEDKALARSEIAEIIQAVAPTIKFTIE